MVCNFSPLGYAPTSMIHKQGHYRTERIMAGHSQFKNIMHRKGRQDAKRAREFTRLIREVQVAARSGLSSPALGRNLMFHGAAYVRGFFNELLDGPAGPVVVFFSTFVKQTQAAPPGLNGVRRPDCLFTWNPQIPYSLFRAGPKAGSLSHGVSSELET